jgi:hypothetical protein
MKRILAGIGWFVAFWLALYLIACVALSVYVSRSLPADANYQQGMETVSGFMLGHASLVSTLLWSISLVALLAAAVGTLKGILPGTRKPAA